MIDSEKVLFKKGQTAMHDLKSMVNEKLGVPQANVPRANVPRALEDMPRTVGMKMQDVRKVFATPDATTMMQTVRDSEQRAGLSGEGVPFMARVDRLVALCNLVDEMKRQLGLAGGIERVIGDAETQLDLDTSGSLAERADRISGTLQV